MEYYRRNSNIRSHPKVVAAGFWGHEVFTALCDISGEFDLGGELPAHYCSPDYLVRRLNVWDGDCPPGGALQAVCNGMQRARVAGLVAQHDDGSLSILGWLERNPTMPLNSTQRSQKRRELMRVDRMQRNATQGTLPGVAATQERRGEERREKDPATVLLLGERVTAPPVNETPDGALVVFEHWKSVMGKNARATFDEKRRRAVVRAMERHGYTVVDLLAAIDGCKASAFHQGHNQERRIYDDLELICRDPVRIDQFMKIAASGGGLNVSMGRVAAESQDAAQHELTPEERARLGGHRG